MSLRWIDAFAFQIFMGIAARCKQQRRKAVRNDTVDFFRHSSVKASEVGFDVGDWNDQLGRNDIARHRRTSPTTRINSGCSFSHTFSNSTIMRAVCSELLPEPTS